MRVACSKLGLKPGMRLLDVGCGWGSLAINAASRYGVSVVGITISQEQARWARKQVAEEGLTELVEIRVQDYRDVPDGPYDAISSVGMSEHVGKAQLQGYSQSLMDLLRPGGACLTTPSPRSARPPPPSQTQPGFIDRYIFPDGKVVPLSTLAGRPGAGRLSRCAMSRRSGSTTVRPCGVGSTTCGRDGRRPNSLSARPGTHLAALPGRLRVGF